MLIKLATISLLVNKGIKFQDGCQTKPLSAGTKIVLITFFTIVKQIPLL